MKRILCIAQSCCDMIFSNLPSFPGPGQEVYGDSFVIRPGGGANTPINLGALGADVTFLTGLGDDEMGRQILRALEHSGVRTVGRLSEPGTRTAVSAVLSTRQDRGFASFAGTAGHFFAPQQLEEEIQRADIVHTYLGYSISLGIGQLCEQYGKALSLDLSWCDAQNTQQVWQELKRCTWLKLNDAEAVKVTGSEEPEAALRQLAQVVKKGVVITLGKRGSIGMHRHGSSPELIRQCPVFKGEFRDACGAGDAYAAGLLLGISRGSDLAESMELGAEVSGLCVTWLGGNSDGLNCTMLSKRFCTNQRKAP